MLLSLVDLLRCPSPHEASSLVLSVEEWAGQRIREGVLGCPVCHARYPIHRGHVDFTGGSSGVRQSRPEGVDPVRLAAQLGLAEAGGVILLAGRYATVHEAVADLSEVACFLIDAQESSSPLAVNLEVGDRLPLVDRALRGGAVDSPRASLLHEIARCLQPNGRVVAPDESPRPSGVRIVAQDAVEWVGEVDSSPPIQLTRKAGLKV